MKHLVFGLIFFASLTATSSDKKWPILPAEHELSFVIKGLDREPTDYRSALSPEYFQFTEDLKKQGLFKFVVGSKVEIDYRAGQTLHADVPGGVNPELHATVSPSFTTVTLVFAAGMVRAEQPLFKLLPPDPGQAGATVCRTYYTNIFLLDTLDKIVKKYGKHISSEGDGGGPCNKYVNNYYDLPKQALNHLIDAWDTEE